MTTNIPKWLATQGLCVVAFQQKGYLSLYNAKPKWSKHPKMNSYPGFPSGSDRRVRRENRTVIV